MAYILGFFAADGNLSINKRGGCYVSFHSKDRQIILDIRKIIDSKNKIEKRTSKLSDGFYYRLQIGSKEIVEVLQSIGFSTNKTKHLPFPNIPKNFLPDFTRGYFDGDGNIWRGEVHKKRRTRHKVLQLAFTSGSFHFLNELKCYLHDSLKTEGSHVVSNRGQYSRLQYSTKDALKIYNFMYNNNNLLLCLKRKKKAFDRSIRYMRL